MKEQLRLLAEAARRPNVVLQVIPLAVGAHQSMSGNFVIAQFERAAPLVKRGDADPARGR